MNFNQTFKLLFFITVLFNFQSCKKDSNNAKIIKLNLEETINSIDGELINVPQFVNPGKMYINDDLIFVSDSKSENFIHVFDLKNLDYLVNIGIKGKGPGEALSCASINYNDNKVWLYDITLAKLVSFNIDSLINGSSTYRYSDEIIMKESARQNFSPQWLDKNTIVSTSFSESVNRIMYTNTEGQVEKEGFPFIEPEDKNVPVSIHNVSYQGVHSIHPTQKKSVVVNRYSDLMEIYDHDMQTSKLIKTHQDFTPIYQVVNSGGDVRMGQGDDTRFGYIDVTVSKDKIFTLYSGRTRGEGFANYANKVYVYDWNGNYINSYKIPNLAISITCDEKNNFYTMEYKGGIPMLKKYRVDE